MFYTDWHPSRQDSAYDDPKQLTSLWDQAIVDEDEKISDDDKAAWLERTSVRQEIDALIMPYANDDEVRFTYEELLVMAVLCSRTRSVTVEEARLWMARNFLGYRAMAVIDWVLHKRTDRQEWFQRPDARFARVKLRGILNKNVIENVLKVHTFALCENLVEEGGMLTIPTCSGRIFLSRWLDPAKAQLFRFMDLYPELRIKVYEMALSFPSGGIAVRPPRRDSSSCWYLWGRRPGTDTQTWYLGGGVTAFMRPNFALLRTNKQINLETKGLLFKLDTFNFWYDDASRVGKIMGARNFENLRSINIYDTTNYYIDALRTDTPLEEDAYAFLERRQILKVVKVEVSCVPGWDPKSPPNLPNESDGKLFEGLAALGARTATFKVESNCAAVKEYVQRRAEQYRVSWVEG